MNSQTLSNESGKFKEPKSDRMCQFLGTEKYQKSSDSGPINSQNRSAKFLELETDEIDQCLRQETV